MPRRGSALPLLASLATLAVAGPAWLGCTRHEALPPELGDPAAPGPSDEEAIRTLPYATWVPIAGDARRGVTYYDREKAEPGLNLFTPRHLARAFLVDMEGRTVHTWSARTRQGQAWQHVELLPQGDLIAVDKDSFIVRVSLDSKLRWMENGAFHHDFAPDLERGRVWAIERRDRVVEQAGERFTVLDDVLLTLDLESGDRLGEAISLWDLLQPTLTAYRLEGIRRERESRGEAPQPDSAGDVFHCNSIEVLTRDLPPVGHQGDLLISVRELDLLATVDPEARRLRWSWGPGVLQQQHHPSLLDDGHVLVFDNRPIDKASRVVELDPVEDVLAWTYQSDPPRLFYSEKRGGAQRLPGGNTLITESDKGRAFEVTPGGEVVWEYFCPAVQTTPGGKKARAAFFRVTRIVAPERYGLGRFASPTR